MSEFNLAHVFLDPRQFYCHYYFLSDDDDNVLGCFCYLSKFF